MFTPEERTRVRERVVAFVREDARVSGGALTGSSSVGAEDRWSDIDLSFGIVDGVEPKAVLDEWTAVLEPELGALHRWDLRHAATIYRVFLLPGGLELDIAVTPAAAFGPRGPKFQPLFGETAHVPAAEPTPVDELIGFGWIFAFSARAAIERGRRWQAEYWISALRDEAFALACVRLGEPPDYARGVDRLPTELTAPFEDALVCSLEESELRRALAKATTAFLAEVEETSPALAARLRPELAELISGAGESSD
jgi:hypothetical protein